MENELKGKFWAKNSSKNGIISKKINNNSNKKKEIYLSEKKKCSLYSCVFLKSNSILKNALNKRKKKISVKSHEFWRLFVLGHIKIVTLTSIYNFSYVSMCAWAEEAAESIPLGNKSIENWQVLTAGFNHTL